MIYGIAGINLFTVIGLLSKGYTGGFMFKEFYEMENGFHFNRGLLFFALDKMVFENGIGYSLEQSTQLAKKYDVTFNSHFNEFDWCYALNLIYSDFFDSDFDDEMYVRLTKKFLYDADFKDGKAYKFFVLSQE